MSEYLMLDDLHFRWIKMNVESACEQQIVHWVKQDPLRVKALECVSKLGLPQSYIAAGFVRNLVWDHLHDKAELTPLNDVDVIYFDQDEQDDKAHRVYEARLHQMMPELNWQVRNQANMHKRNGDQPYQSSLDAMGYWPEKETAVAIRQCEDGQYMCVAAFGFGSLFALKLSYNPKRKRSLFDYRVATKKWLTHWLYLKLF
jgi:hypothetical protein